MKKSNTEEDLQFFLNAIEKPIAVINLQGILLKANQTFTDVFGVNEEDCIEQIVTGQSLETWKNILQRTIHEKKVNCELQMVFFKVETYTVDMSLRFDETTEKVIIYMYLPYELMHLPQYNMNNLPTKLEELMIICDANGRIQNVGGLARKYFSQSKEKLLQYSVEQILSLFPEHSLDLEVLRREVDEMGYMETVQKYIHATGHVRYYKIAAIKDHITNLYLIKIKDQTKETIVQQQLAHKDSLLEVGQLAASVAHEIRNPITTLKGFTQLLKVTAEEETLKYLNVIEDEIHRMEEILSEMLNLSKPTVRNKKIISVNGLIKNIVRIIHPKATLENKKIIQNYERNFEMCLVGEEGRLKQVFLNLLKNSLESMHPGGTLSIFTQKCEGNFVNIIIKDTGKGIDEQNLNQIFMPYFTTRPDGTGLGLPFVLKTVEDHEGTVSVSSEVGKGTSFILTFPLIEQNYAIHKETVKEIVG